MKYIIDIPSELLIKDDGYSFSDGKSYCVTGNLSKLTPYVEPDRKAIEDEVWEFATTCAKMDGADSVDVFGGYSLESFTKYSYQEAKSKFEAWMKDKIHVGDEIVGIYSDGEKTSPLVVLKVEGNYYYGIYSKTGEFVQGGLNYEKTGRHFDEVTELLEKMRERNNEICS